MSTIGERVTSQKGYLVVNKPGFNNMADICNIFRNIAFDKTQFLVRQLGDSISVSLQGDSAGLGAEEEHHWLVESNATSSNSSSWIVRGGYWLRELEEGLGVSKIPLTCDTGVWNEDYDARYKSITTATNVGSYYVYLELDHPLKPTTCVVKSSTTWPAYTNAKSTMVIAKTNCTSGTVEQYLEGDYYDATYARPDAQLPGQSSYSISVNNSTGRTIQYDFVNPPNTGMVAGDLVEFRQVTGIGGVPTLRYTSKVLDSVHADDADDALHADDADHAISSDWADYANAGSWPTSFDHPSLTDRNLSDAGGHSYYWAYSGWRNPDNLSYKTTGDCFSNQFAIQENSTLNYWTNAAAKITSSDFISLVTKTNDIDITAKRNLNESAVIHSSCSTSYTIIQSVGNVSSVSSSGFIKLDGDAGVIIDSDANLVLVSTGNLDVDAGGTVDIYGTSSLQISAQGGRAILLDADIDLQTGGQLQVNGTPGVTMTGYSVLDTTTGELHSIATTKGLMTTG